MHRDRKSLRQVAPQTKKQPAGVETKEKDHGISQVLQEWCRVTCAGYSNVEVKDWSSSFRSGLAFCAIIHKYRPELIDFSSLSKNDAYENTKMAFELAETKLGVPMLLDAGEITSASEPDRLAVITCLFQLYFVFNRKSIDFASLKSMCDASLNSSAKSVQDSKSLTHLEFTGKYRSSDTKPQVKCNLCLKPVHLIQRRVVDGKVYHRKCFRCRHCHLSLLPGTYTANSLICSHHLKHHREATFKQKDTYRYLSLSGLAISRVPHYPVKTEPPAKQLPDCVEDENGCSKEKHGAGITLEHTESILGGDPAPRPAPRLRMTSYGTTSSPNPSTSGTQGTSDKTSGSAPVVTHRGSSPARGSCQVRTNHPWLKIIHPGPWTQLPPRRPLCILSDPKEHPPPRPTETDNKNLHWNLRKVQADQASSSQDLLLQIEQVAKQLEAVEEKGVELERNIRHCTNNKEEEKLLTDWFALIHQRHVLERKDKELVYLIKQQELEQRQEDVEYTLRCLLNRPEREWSEQERQQETQLMEELLHIIDQRNQIISSLDQDVQREREDDMKWETLVKNKDVQKCELKELKKSKETFKTTSVFKIINKKTESKREKKS
ncbi:hypothetical protein WMY93_002703 [Mugilogobius chulae]|uniref:MICAL-like protein 1 n=1 Tax=Mugilogobius chulae TaxID=88201 RepID=A0AAW0PXW5_9GOBI